MLKHLIFLFSIAASINILANETSAERAASDERAGILVNRELDLVTQDLSNLRFKETTLRAVESIIQHAVKELRNQKLFSDSKDLEADWIFFKNSQFSVLDLGDHRPLSLWLKEKHDWLESKLGPRVMKLTRLSDIKVFNHAIPVVYNPTCSDWDQLEYQKHFVPYMGASVYWISRGTCSIMLTLPASLACVPAALAVRMVTEKAIAPHASNLVYVRANKKQN